MSARSSSVNTKNSACTWLSPWLSSKQGGWGRLWSTMTIWCANWGKMTSLKEGKLKRSLFGGKTQWAMIVPWIWRRKWRRNKKRQKKREQMKKKGRWWTNWCSMLSKICSMIEATSATKLNSGFHKGYEITSNWASGTSRGISREPKWKGLRWPRQRKMLQRRRLKRIRQTRTGPRRALTRLPWRKIPLRINSNKLIWPTWTRPLPMEVFDAMRGNTMRGRRGSWPRGWASRRWGTMTEYDSISFH